MKRSIRTVFSALLLVVFVFSISGCSFNGGKTISDYVESVRECTRVTVNVTRELRKQIETTDCRIKLDAKLIIEKIDLLSEYYNSLVKREAPDRYSDLDADLKKEASDALSQLSALRSLVNTAMNTGNDELFRASCSSIMDEYNKTVDDLVNTSAQITTRFRND